MVGAELPPYLLTSSPRVRLSQTMPAEVVKGGVDETAVEALKKEKEGIYVQRRSAEEKIEKCRTVQA